MSDGAYPRRERRGIAPVPPIIKGKEEIEKHKHFFEGLMKAGLDYDELEEMVLSQRDN